MGGKLGTLFARAGHGVVFSYAKPFFLQDASLVPMNSDEIKCRTFEIIDSSREELISFLREYIQHAVLETYLGTEFMASTNTSKSIPCLTLRKRMRVS